MYFFCRKEIANATTPPNRNSPRHNDDRGERKRERAKGRERKTNGGDFR